MQRQNERKYAKAKQSIVDEIKAGFSQFEQQDVQSSPNKKSRTDLEDEIKKQKDARNSARSNLEDYPTNPRSRAGTEHA